METKFTKGEWNWNYDDSTKTGIKITTGDEQIVDFVGGSNLYEAEANAKLIAAAPEMLEVIIELQKRFNKNGNLTGDLWELCEKAIKKATE